MSSTLCAPNQAAVAGLARPCAYFGHGTWVSAPVMFTGGVANSLARPWAHLIETDTKRHHRRHRRQTT